MARPRVPACYAIVQLGLRITSASLSLATLVIATYISARFYYEKQMIGVFVAVGFLHLFLQECVVLTIYMTNVSKTDYLGTRRRCVRDCAFIRHEKNHASLL
jgi:hypothetical protein